MTNSEIDNMPAGPELDALIAEKVMGWKCVTATEDLIGFGFVPKGTECIIYAKPQCKLADARIWYGERSHSWRPSRDIAAAWEVVEKTMLLVPVIRLCGNGIEWMASYTNSGAYSVSETAPLAICRAALRAVTK
jgi:hypothetical protein